MAKAGSLDNMGVITGKEVAKKKEHEQIEKGVREQSFHLKRNYNDDQHRITRSSREEENSNLPLEKAHRDSLYEEEETESVDESQYAIARPQVPVMNEAVRDLPDEDPVDYPGTDFTNESSSSEITGDDGAPAIERPAVQGMPEKREMMQDRQKEELLKNTDLADENKNDNINDPDLMITGVPLDELNACTDALDERMLKKKILNVIGKNMGCYRKGLGEFLFMGTSRFASFDMKVRPQGGRKLANRCEELKNAYYCLTSERNN
jgi:hypothetical protein